MHLSNIHSRWCMLLLWMMWPPERVNGLNWSLEILSDVVQSHTKSLDIVHNYIRKTDHFWNWLMENQSDLTTLLKKTKLKSAGLKTASNETEIVFQEMKNQIAKLKKENFSQEIEDMKKFIKHEINQKDEKIAELNSKYESVYDQLMKSQNEIEKLHKGYNASITNVMGFSKQLSKNANATLELLKEDIGRLDNRSSHVYEILETQGKVHVITSSMENRITAIETQLRNYQNISSFNADTYANLNTSIALMKSQLDLFVASKNNESGRQLEVLENTLASNQKEIAKLYNRTHDMEKEFQILRERIKYPNLNKTENLPDHSSGFKSKTEKSKISGGINTLWPSRLIENSSFIFQRTTDTPVHNKALNDSKTKLNPLSVNVTGPSINVYPSPAANISNENDSPNASDVPEGGYPMSTHGNLPPKLNKNVDHVLVTPKSELVETTTMAGVINPTNNKIK